MGAEPPRPDADPEPRGPAIGQAAEHSPIGAADADRAARSYWEATADEYQAEHGAFLSGAAGAGTGFVWGPEGRTEADLQVLATAGGLPGLRILEVGCGAAQCSAWLASRGAIAIGLDIAVAQLRHARTGGDAAHLVAATATALPFADDSFDCAFSAYGAVQFVADLDRLLAEVSRVLRPGGRWAFSVTHPIRWAFPDDPSGAGLAVSTSYFDRTPYVERAADGTVEYAEVHRTLGDYVSAMVRAGFRLDTLIEPEWPDWNEQEWGGWSPLRGHYLPGTLILGGRTPSTSTD